MTSLKIIPKVLLSRPGIHPNFLGVSKKNSKQDIPIFNYWTEKTIFYRSQVLSMQAYLIIHSLAQKSSLTRIYFCSSRHGVELEECK